MLHLSPLGGSHLSASQNSTNFQPQRNCLSRHTRLHFRLHQQQQPAQPGRWFATSGSTVEAAETEQNSQRVAEQGTASTSGRGLPTGEDQAAQAIVEMDTELMQHNGAPKKRRHKKAGLYLVRTDGLSCSRETVEATGCLTFAHPSTQQHLLVWKERPKCAMVLKKLGSELGSEFRNTIALLQKENIKVIIEPHEYEAWGDMTGSDLLDTFSEDELPVLHQAVDFVVCLGGDGVILHASYLFASSIPPVISFNLGSMGFLTNHSYRNYAEDIMGVIEGDQDLGHCSIDQEMYGVHITLRMRLMCQIHRKDGSKGDQIEVLNEVVVDRGANPYLTKIECWEHDRLITKVQADGVMLATPTGSTAYSVAAGGSMVHPNVPAILFTPICPHSLSFRPVILPDYACIDLRIPEKSRGQAWVCFDGKQRQELQPGDYVNVCMSPNPVPTINKTDQTNDWFTSLERCFGWNERVEQKGAAPRTPTEAAGSGSRAETEAQSPEASRAQG